MSNNIAVTICSPARAQLIIALLAPMYAKEAFGQDYTVNGEKKCALGMLMLPEAVETFSELHAEVLETAGEVELHLFLDTDKSLQDLVLSFVPLRIVPWHVCLEFPTTLPEPDTDNANRLCDFGRTLANMARLIEGSNLIGGTPVQATKARSYGLAFGFHRRPADTSEFRKLLEGFCTDVAESEQHSQHALRIVERQNVDLYSPERREEVSK